MESFKVYHHPGCQETVKLLQVLDEYNLQYTTFTIGETVTQEEYDAMMDEYSEIRDCPRVLQSTDNGEWINMGNAELVIPVLNHVFGSNS